MGEKLAHPKPPAGIAASREGRRTVRSCQATGYQAYAHILERKLCPDVLCSDASRNPNGKGLVEWPRYKLNEEYLELNLEQRAREKLKGNKMDFWLKSLPEKMKLLQEATEAHKEL